MTGALQQFLREMRDRCDWCRQPLDLAHEFSLFCPIMAPINRETLDVIRRQCNESNPLAVWFTKEFAKHQRGERPSSYQQRIGYRVRVRP
jgi:hypothetical protein